MGLCPRNRSRSYDLEQRIAVGGMGEVYRGRAPELGRPVAIKRVLDADASDENLRLLFLREVAVAATLEHHHVVEVIDAGSTANELFLVMEYVDGPSLAEVLDALYRQGRLLPVDLACGIVSQVAVGLAHAHERSMPDGTPLGIIHRDVAVENVLIGQNGIPKLVDFGLAKLTGHSLTEPGVVRGRPRTLSPEQARGDKVTARSDIFSLGAVLFELVSGEQLYPNESTASLLFKVAAGEYEPISGRVPEATDPDLVAIVERSIAVDPDARYGSARQMVRELDAFRAARGLRMSSRSLARLIGELLPSIQERRGTPQPGELECSRIELPADPPGMSVEPPPFDPNLRDEVHAPPSSSDFTSARAASRSPKRTAADALRTPVADEPVTAPAALPLELSEPPEPVTVAVERPAGLDESEEASPAGSPGLTVSRSDSPDPERADVDASSELRSWGVTADLRRRGSSVPDAVTSALADQLSAPAGLVDSSLPRPRRPARMTGSEKAARGWVVYAWVVTVVALFAGVLTYFVP